MNDNKEPYKEVGDQIRQWRQKWNQSLAEISATLEIDLNILRSIESGKILPSDDQLDMLMSHFLMNEEQATELMDIIDSANGRSGQPASSIPFGQDISGQIMMMVVSADSAKSSYTDGMHASVDDKGVVLEFTQRSTDGKSVTVSRLGMSHNHAVEVSRVISDTLNQYSRNMNNMLSKDNPIKPTLKDSKKDTKSSDQKNNDQKK